MTVNDLLIEAYKSIHKTEANMILATLLNENPLELLIHLDKIVPSDICTIYKECINNINNGIPVQYALKSVSFMGYDFYVDNRVLIPRFETEELVDNTINYIKKYFNNSINVLDLCSGSGCIGISLKKSLPNINVTLSDISKDAIDVSNINKDKLNTNVKIIESDLFNNINQKYDVLISNPPYISYNEEIDEIVMKNEPHIALYADNDGLYFYENILKDCEKYLNEKYLIAFEIGYTQLDSITKIINKYLKDVKIISKKDLSEKDRMVFIFKNLDINE